MLPSFINHVQHTVEQSIGFAMYWYAPYMWICKWPDSTLRTPKHHLWMDWTWTLHRQTKQTIRACVLCKHYMVPFSTWLTTRHIEEYARMMTTSSTTIHVQCTGSKYVCRVSNEPSEHPRRRRQIRQRCTWRTLIVKNLARNNYFNDCTHAPVPPTCFRREGDARLCAQPDDANNDRCGWGVRPLQTHVLAFMRSRCVFCEVVMRL